MVGIQIGTIRVGAMQSDAGVFFGQNMQNGWDSHSKSNRGGATINGDFNYCPSLFNLVHDMDVIDSPIFDQDIKSPTLAHIMGV